MQFRLSKSSLLQNYCSNTSLDSLLAKACDHQSHTHPLWKGIGQSPRPLKSCCIKRGSNSRCSLFMHFDSIKKLWIEFLSVCKLSKSERMLQALVLGGAVESGRARGRRVVARTALEAVQMLKEPGSNIITCQTHPPWRRIVSISARLGIKVCSPR